MGRDEVLDVVLEVIQSVLGDPSVTAADNFFAVGGDSLAALEVVSLVEERLGAEIPMEAIYDADTLGDYAGVIAEAVGA